METQQNNNEKTLVKQPVFDNAFMGYDKQQVDNYIAKMTTEYSAVYAEYASQNTKVKTIVSSALKMKQQVDEATERIKVMSAEKGELEEKVKALTAQIDALKGDAKVAEKTSATKYADIFAMAQSSVDSYVKKVESDMQEKKEIADAEAIRIVDDAKNEANEIIASAHNRELSIVAEAREAAIAIQNMIVACVSDINTKINETVDKDKI